MGWISVDSKFKLPMGRWTDMDDGIAKDNVKSRESAILPVISQAKQLYAWRWELSTGETGWTEAFEHREIRVSHYFVLPPISSAP